MIKNSFPKRKKVYVAPSPIHGYGIFAKQDLKKGEVVYRITGKRVHWIVKDKKTAQAGEDWFGLGENIWIDPEGGIPRYQNHSRNPSCGIRGSVTVCALRNIKKDEEITIDYSITEAEPLWTMIDSTTQGPERIVRSIQFLAEHRFKKYLPYIPRYFQQIYKSHRSLKKGKD